MANSDELLLLEPTGIAFAAWQEELDALRAQLVPAPLGDPASGGSYAAARVHHEVQVERARRALLGGSR